MNIAVLGYGTVGSGVVEILKVKKEYQIKYIYNRFNLHKKKLLGDLYTDDINQVIEDKEVDVVIETMGGMGAYEIIKKALLNKKHVITANKEVVAIHLDELRKLAQSNQVMLFFEASVGGAIPIIYNVCDLIKTDSINYLCGILNGTTNYILTRINEGISFDDALLEAQNLGYAESDPKADLMGLDMVRKITILAMLATNSHINIAEVYHFGVKNINLEFVKAAKEKGKTIKFIAEAIVVENHINLFVEPVALEQNSLLANLNYAYNGVLLETKNHGQLFYSGLGAGKIPTASAIISDLYHIKNQNNYLNYKSINNFNCQLLNDCNDYYVLENNKCILKKNISRKEAKNHQFYARVI